MIISSVKPLGKKRYRIQREDGLTLALYQGELFKYHLQEGSELPDSTVEEIVKTILCKRAENRLLLVLQKKDYTEKQLIQKLREGYYPQEAIEYAITKMKEFGYVDDNRYAENYIRYRIDHKSQKQITQELVLKGIKKDYVDQAFLAVAEEGYAFDEMALIKKVLDKRHFDAKTADYKERSKQYNYLLGKGFSRENIQKALSLDLFS